ncbi:AraC family transcriptional regulator [Anaeromicropila herbilytica]|uniref:AraC family transcriptional regulator n=1 Tax=Anaeromicropila herbilytica TaxID=2785025 RepID=A0A7R7EIG4_9FIRM|nr:AraC family transcriptional regulator [Anaeromicropila herbilytica]BCN29315.1 AraC family transcriptional regulator [Anaeromicropila herbilytica]
MNDTNIRENKTHGHVSFPYIVYPGNIPEYIHSYPLHWHEEMELIYNQKGRGYVTVQSTRYELHDGDMILILPHELHSIEQCEDNKMEYYNILFQYSLLTNHTKDICFEKYFKPFLDHTRTIPVHITKSHELYQQLYPYIIDLIIHREESFSNYELMVKSNLFTIMHLLNRYSLPIDDDYIRMEDIYIKLKNVLLHIEKNYNIEISVKDAAHICGFSESHFMKLFKTITGKSFTQYLKDYRLEIAGRKLLETELKIIEISENCGFNNHSYFIRSFCEKYGTTPSKYRKVYGKK